MQHSYLHICLQLMQEMRRVAILHCGVEDQTELFRLTLVSDQTLVLILLKFGLNCKIRPNASCHFNNLCKLVLRPKFGLRTKSDHFLPSCPMCVGMLNEVRIFELRKKYSNSNSFLTLRSSTSKYRLV